VEKLKSLLIKHEGIRLKPYKDTRGILTIGVGRNLEQVGLSAMEVDFLLSNDIVRVSTEALASFPWLKDLNEARQDVILSMIFNLGLSKFKQFAKVIEAVQAHQYDKAAFEMLSSSWAAQVGQRANELAHMMSTGEYQA
jgi:lysozyme